MPPGRLSTLALSPEWYLLLATLSLLGLLGTRWAPLLLALPLLALAAAATALEASLTAARVAGMRTPHARAAQPLKHALSVCLQVLQPAARLAGRVRLGLVPWRRRGSRRLRMPTVHTDGAWSELWASPEQWLGDLETTLAESGDTARRGGPYDRWDLQVRGGTFGRARVLAGVEEHGHGRQMIRLRAWPVPSFTGVALSGLLVALATVAYRDGAHATGLLLGSLALALAAWCFHDCAAAIGAFRPATLERVLARRQAARAPLQEPHQETTEAVAAAWPPATTPWVLTIQAAPRGRRASSAAARPARAERPRSL
jgi:hypothetical protein